VKRRLAVVFAALVLMALLGASVHAISKRRAEQKRRLETTDRLQMLCFVLTHHDLGQVATDLPPPRATGGSGDPTGMIALHEYLMGGHYLLNSEPGTAGSAFLNGDLSNDAWGRPIVYRCPGVVHKEGFDFYSFGPDGRDDEGRGDDLVEGMDLSAASSPATSPSPGAPDTTAAERSTSR
jgi:hypothetical protein